MRPNEAFGLTTAEAALLVSGAAILVGGGFGLWLARVRGAIVAGLVLIALTPLVPTLRIPMALGLSSDDLLPLLGLGFLVVGLFERGGTGLRGHRWSPLQVGLAAGVSLIVAGGLISAVINAGNPIEGLRLLFRGAGRFALLGLIGWTVGEAVARQPERSQLVGRALAIVATAEAAFGVAAYLLPLPGRLGLEAARRQTSLFGEVPGRVAGTLGISPDFTATILMASVVVTTGLAMGRTGRARVAWLTAAGVQLAALGLTFARVPIVLALVGLVTVVLVTRRPIVLLPVAAAIAALGAFTPIVTRFLSDANDRLALWTAGFRMMVDHPAGGVGAGRMLETMRANPERYMTTPFGHATNNAHNTILLAGAELGVLAALGALVLNAAIGIGALLAVAGGLRGARRAAGEAPAALASAGGVAILLILAQGMANNLFTVGATSILLALLVGTFVWPMGQRPSIPAEEPQVT